MVITLFNHYVSYILCTNMVFIFNHSLLLKINNEIIKVIIEIITEIELFIATFWKLKVKDLIKINLRSKTLPLILKFFNNGLIL